MKDAELLDSLKIRMAESEFLAAGGKPGGADDISFFQAVMKLHGDRLKFSPTGELEATDKGGARLFSPTNPDLPMNAREFFESLRSGSLSHCFDAKPVRGANPASPTPIPPNRRTCC